MSCPARPCPVCLSEDKERVYRQEFSAYSEGTLMEGYDLVLCNSCGAAFADYIPEQAAFDTYYARMSKYEFDASSGAPDSTTAARYRQVVDLLESFIPRDARVADVGCATGGLLGEFKNRGFENVTGFDPSLACARAAERWHNVRVHTATIAELSSITDRFDIILLTGVMEHVRDVDPALDRIISLLCRGGRLYLEVPDVTRYERWFSAPFQFLSMEHVNFFSPVSLANLVRRHGMREVFTRRVDRFLSERAGEPAVASLFQRADDVSAKPELVFDAETKPTLLAYLEKSRALEEQIVEKVAAFVEQQTPLAVWGAGTHTLRLLKIAGLDRANVVAFIDSNRSYHGKELHGVKIVAPSAFERRDVPILISSHAAEAQIKSHIENVLRWPNELICLYEGAPLQTATPLP